MVEKIMKGIEIIFYIAVTAIVVFIVGVGLYTLGNLGVF